MTGLKRPRPLKPGDTVAVIAASSRSKPEAVKKAEKGLTDLGFKVIIGNSCYAEHGNLSGTDVERAGDINKMFTDPSVDGIFMLTGGYGSQRCYNLLDIEVIKNNPKFFIGYSDVTMLLNIINQQGGFVAYHGPMASTAYENFDEYSYSHFKKCVFSDEALGSITNPPEREIKTLIGGKAEGVLTGGNLSLLASSIGTAYEIDTKGKIFLIEDVNERLYKIDRMLVQLLNAGKFKDCAGVIFGDFANCPPEKPSEEYKILSLEDIFNDLIMPIKKPVIYNVACGHCMPTLTLPFGSVMKLDADNRSMTIL